MSANPSGMKVGINYPWKNYGWDFGEGPWGMRRAWEATLVDELRALRRIGVHAVRWFILGDGITYGIREHAPVEDPARLWHKQSQWRFIPPVGDAVRPVLEDFRALLECFRRANEGGGEPLRLMPAVLDFHLFFPGNCESGPFKAAGNTGAPPPAGFVKNGRMDLAVDPAKTRLFLDGLLSPLVAIASEDSFRGLIHSVDVFNEPEWCTDDGRKEPRRTIPLARMLEFLRQCADVVRPHFKPTVGFAERETLLKWNASALDLGLWQYHYYGKPRDVPEAKLPVPCVVGEFATTADAQWGDQRVGERLEALEKKGYGEVFAWSAHATDRATRWDDEVRADIAAFTQRK